MSYKVYLNQLRASEKEGKMYAKARAVANGPDSYKSVFTENARSSLISQLKTNGVQTNALHSNAIVENIEKYLRARLERAYGDEKEDVMDLLGSLPNMDHPIGTVVDAYFVDDKTVEVLIEENSDLKLMGSNEANYLESAWNMIKEGVLGGVSLVFNDLVTMMSGEKLIIDDLNVRGLDFVPRPSHPDTRVLDTFMRAAQDSTNIHKEEMRSSGDKKMTNEEKPIEKPSPVVDVDELVAKAEKKVEANLEAKAQEKAEIEAEKEAIRKEYAEKLKAKDDELSRVAQEKEEAVSLAEEALETSRKFAAKIDNPFAERAKAADEKKDPLEGKSIRELVKMKLEAQ